MEAISTPRVSGSIIASFTGRNVMVVGKVLQLRGDTATIDADGHITAQLNRDSHLQAGNAAQIIGKVLPDYSIKVMSSTDLGNNVDLNVAQAVVEVSHQFPDLFIFPDGAMQH